MAVKIVKYVGEWLTVYATIKNHGVDQTMYTAAHLFKPGTTYAIGLAPSIGSDNPVAIDSGASIDVDFVGDIPSEVADVVVEAGLYDVVIQVYRAVGDGELVKEKILTGELEIKTGPKKEILDIRYA